MEMAMTKINIKNAPKIVNMEYMARGTGAKFLECTKAHIEGILIAKQWRRTEPKQYDVLVEF